MFITDSIVTKSIMRLVIMENTHTTIMPALKCLIIMETPLQSTKLALYHMLNHIILLTDNM